MGDLSPSIYTAVPVSPVPGIEVSRYPLVDPESGEEIRATELPAPVATAQKAPVASAPPLRRSSVILRSLALHIAIVSVIGLVTMIILGQLGLTPATEAYQTFQTDVADLTQRFESRQISQEEVNREVQQLLDTHGMKRLLMIISGPVLLAFLVAGFLAGRLWRPSRLIDIGLSGLIVGGLCALCLISPLIWPMGIALSMLGALFGRRKK